MSARDQRCCRRPSGRVQVKSALRYHQTSDLMTHGTLPQWFHILVVPVILMGLGMLARRLGRRDGDPSPQRNDMAVGTSVLLMSFGAVAADLRNESNIADVVDLLGW